MMTSRQRGALLFWLFVALAAFVVLGLVLRRQQGGGGWNLGFGEDGGGAAGVGARDEAEAGDPDVLVLDVDETLVHSLPPDHTKVIERPHVRAFLDAVREAFGEVAVFTAGTREYASPILDRLDPDSRIFGRRFYRDSCSVDPRTGLVVKDLRILGQRDLARVTILDNTPSAYALQPQCGVPIANFEGDPRDRALIDVLPVLLARRRHQQHLMHPTFRALP